MWDEPITWGVQITISAMVIGLCLLIGGALALYGHIADRGMRRAATRRDLDAIGKVRHDEDCETHDAYIGASPMLSHNLVSRHPLPVGRKSVDGRSIRLWRGGSVPPETADVGDLWTDAAGVTREYRLCSDPGTGGHYYRWVQV